MTSRATIGLVGLSYDWYDSYESSMTIIQLTYDWQDFYRTGWTIIGQVGLYRTIMGLVGLLQTGRTSIVLLQDWQNFHRTGMLFIGLFGLSQDWQTMDGKTRKTTIGLVGLSEDKQDYQRTSRTITGLIEPPQYTAVEGPYQWSRIATVQQDSFGPVGRLRMGTTTTNQGVPPRDIKTAVSRAEV